MFCKTIAMATLCATTLLSGCMPEAPKLPEMEVKESIRTSYSSALQELNTVLEVYLPPEYPDTFYYVKPIMDDTGISNTGEIPLGITTLVRDAIAQVYHKIRYVEQYDASDQQHLSVESMLMSSSKVKLAVKPAIRPTANFTIAGSISQFDRNLQSTSGKASAMANFGGGSGQTNLNASAQKSGNVSRLGVSFNVYTPDGVSVPGKFGASVELAYAKNSTDLGFAIFGNGLGFGAEATAMHGRHLALQMMSELCTVQIIGRTMTIPYWRVGAGHNIFKEDPLVIKEWKGQYNSIVNEGLILPFMQSQCIACGDDSVFVNGVMDEATQRAFQNFANKFGIAGDFPSFELYKALELNRLLDTAVAARAWSAYNAYKKCIAAPVAQPAAAKPKSAAPAQSRAVESAPAESNEDTSVESFTKALEGLL